MKLKYGANAFVLRSRLAIEVSLVAALVSGAPCALAAETRLSEWLLQHPPRQDEYPLGLSWRVSEQVPVQQALQRDLISLLSAPDLRPEQRESAARLVSLVASLPVTGRVPVSVADARWLQANPGRDPVIRATDTVVVPRRPSTVTVIRDDGRLCQVQHSAGHEALSYLRACDASSVDWVWLAQPDGRVFRYGVSVWNEQTQDEPAPGAWLWAPRRSSDWPDLVSEQLIEFLSTQGPAADEMPMRSLSPPTLPAIPGGASQRASRVPLPQLTEADALSGPLRKPAGPGLRPVDRSRSLELTENDWGVTGLLQTHTARTQDAGHFVFDVSRTYPYLRVNVFTSPFDWLEAGLRYTNIENRLYGPAEFSGTQAYKDKGFDLKARLWKESAYIPQVAVGIQDLSGTGVFGGEYVVASKRTGSFDWSLGLGWGYLGARGDIRNPLSRFDEKFDTRANTVGQGGNISTKSYFRGPTALFGGVQYQTPWQRLVLKAEYEGNDYQHEALGNNQPQRSPFNFGFVYRYSRSVDLTAAVERGNTLMVGLALRTQLDGLSMPKVSDPAPISVSRQRPVAPPNWAVTGADIGLRTGWHVKDIRQEGRDLYVTVDELGGIYWRDRLDRLAAVLHRDAPANVDRFVVVYDNKGIKETQHVIDRDAWSTPFNEPLPPGARPGAVIAEGKKSNPAGLVLYENERPRFRAGTGIAYQQMLGGPDAFYLYQVSLTENLYFRFNDRTWAQATLAVPLFGNFEKFKFTGSSELPRVRTYVREYFTSDGLKMPNAQITHTGQLSENQFYSAYAGYLEQMFAGVGGEWLYRPRWSRLALGIDINEVQQRDFDQRFSLMDYRVTTGHATAYWDTGWSNVIVTLSVGQYLAGDKGATLQAAKVFQNGTVVGAFATKTNVSAEQFGEGSFDKGIFINIPFDAILTRSSGSVASFLYRPLTRDGGAKLLRAVQLYDVTNLRDNRTLEYKPAPVPNEYRLPADRDDGVVPVRRLSDPIYTAAAKPREVQPGPGFNERLEELLNRQGLRNVRVTLDDSRRLDVTASDPQGRAVSHSVALAARSAAAIAPLDTRELRIRLTKDDFPVADYEFVDMAKLQQYLAGRLPRDEFTRYVNVEYRNLTYAEKEPLAYLTPDAAVLASDADRSLLQGAHPVSRVWEDVKAAGRTTREIEWFKTTAAGVGLVLGSSLLDKQVYKFAKKTEGNSWAKAATKIGDAIPFVAMGAAGAGALLASDPNVSRTSYSAGEAGVAAYLAATGLKYLTGRVRPSDTASHTDFEPLSKDPNRDAFPSRHVAVAFAALTPFAMQYDAPWLYGLGVITQIGRITSREHWFSDTVAGSLVGAAVGQIFYRSSVEPSRSKPRVAVSPRGISLAWEFK